ncbi:hypothetical protein ACHAL6_02385 [Proteiniclasticum sp. C24MP]|uniref:Uncharacterized protein n=1 Tax=Proteiniclasticum aestuarii TaxID=2817862 RepID=A0A939H6R9_9CLOT|nr:hypothetical protein [Proteiniclasticum aestuarii]MBO1265307.1 hypothetical protein [Proteiniclasticum aestuarii]
MNLGLVNAGYLSLLLMFLEVTLRIVAIYTLVILANALKTYIRRNS